jgi:hypothetical protein
MLLTTLSVQSAEPSTQPVLRWQAVAGAHEYEIEVETPDGKAVKRQRTKGTSITLILDPGDYRVRILVLNRFGKTASTGKWSPLVVRRSEDATLRLVEPATVYADETGRRVILHGGHFYPGTSITLEAADGTLTPLSVEIRSEEEATLRDHHREPPGETGPLRRTACRDRPGTDRSIRVLTPGGIFRPADRLARPRSFSGGLPALPARPAGGNPRHTGLCQGHQPHGPPGSREARPR